ncbi:MAG: TIGR04283 family arsenosugar biosynthesis glycosyltransferase [Thermodesulfovibrionales bacterium]
MTGLSVIIPALNEEGYIKVAIESARKLNPLEIIVVDGGSTDRTKEIAEREGAIVIESPMGRGTQLNRGASVAKGDILLFLHADSVIPERVDIRKHINNGQAGGFFRLGFDDPSISIRLVEFFANLRARLFSLPYGDQAIFIKKEVFERIGGFKEYPFLEDLELVRRLKGFVRLKSLPDKVIVSSRRLKKGYPFSPILVSLRNVLIALLFLLGMSPYRLQRFYKSGSPHPSQTAGFPKNPEDFFGDTTGRVA